MSIADKCIENLPSIFCRYLNLNDGKINNEKCHLSKGNVNLQDLFE